MKFSHDIHTYIKLFFVNFIIVIFLFFVLDFIAFYITLNNENKQLIENKKFNICKHYFDKFKPVNEEKLYIYNKTFKPIRNKDSKKAPIIIFGCSYAYGNGLKNKDFSSLLTKATDRPVYNRALSGWGPQHMLYQLQNDNFYQIVPKPEYIIYVFIPKHVSRLYLSDAVQSYKYYTLLYKQDKNYSLKRDNLNAFINKYTIIYLLRRKYFKITHSKNRFTKKDFKLLKLHFLEAKKLANTHWGNDIKFVIVLYQPQKRVIALKPVFEYLKKNGFVIININDMNINFFTSKYKIGNKENIIYNTYDNHPNSNAWEAITPFIVKELNL